MGLVFVALAGMGIFADSPFIWAEACIGPPALEARIHAHPDAEAYSTLGTWFGQNHRLDCAAQVFQSGLKLEPGSALLNYLLGLNLYESGRIQESILPLQQSIQLHPEEVHGHLLLAAALTSLGRDKEALPEWEAALKIDPTSKVALDGLASALIATGDYGTAISQLRSSPRDENLTLDLAIAYGDLGMFDNAAHVLAEGLKTYPNSDDLTRALVTLDFQEGRIEEGLALAEKLALFKAHDIEAQRIYLRTLVTTGNNDVAAPLSRKLLALAPHDPEILTLSGFLERVAGDYRMARKHLDEAVTLSPENTSARFNLGVVLLELQDAAGAKEQLEKAVELGATDPQVHFQLAKALRLLGKTEEAQQQLELYQQRQKEDSDKMQAAVASSLAAQAVKVGDYRKAADLYREACAAQPDSAELAYRLALVLGTLGDFVGERAALEKAIKADPSFVQAQYKLGYLESQAGDDAAAEQQFRIAVKALPGNAQAWVSLAATLGSESRFQEALDAVDNALKLDPNNAAAQDLRMKLVAAQVQH
jgi:tetratricopeptide (TPR) repeat protein